MPFVIEFGSRSLLIVLSEDPSLILPGAAISMGNIRQFDPGESLHAWPLGTDAPTQCIGRDPADPSDYALFRDEKKLREAGFDYVPGAYVQAHRFDDLLDDTKADLLKAFGPKE